MAIEVWKYEEQSIEVALLPSIARAWFWLWPKGGAKSGPKEQQ